MPLSERVTLPRAAYLIQVPGCYAIKRVSAISVHERGHFITLYNTSKDAICLTWGGGDGRGRNIDPNTEVRTTSATPFTQTLGKAFLKLFIWVQVRQT